MIVEWLYRENTENTAESRAPYDDITWKPRIKLDLCRVQVSCECAFAKIQVDYADFHRAGRCVLSPNFELLEISSRPVLQVYRGTI